MFARFKPDGSARPMVYVNAFQVCSVEMQTDSPEDGSRIYFSDSMQRVDVIEPITDVIELLKFVASGKTFQP